jgi:hypothetical protein
MKKLLLVLMMVLSLTSISQVIPNKDLVVQAIGPTGLDVTGLSTAIDFTTGAVYTCGYVNTVSSGKDLILVKLDSNLVQQWVATYDFASLDDKANAVCIDGSGNVYVTGGSNQGSGNADIVTIKYNSSGTQQWVSRVNGTNNTNDQGNSILFDGTNIWVTGYVTTTSKGKDAVILKLNGSSGATIASPKRNGTANADDIGEKVCTDGTSVFIAGTTKNTTTNGDLFVACVNISSATLTWSISVNGSANGDESAYDCKIDNSELYVCGYTNNTTTGNDYYFARINKSNGTINYSNTYDGGYNGSDFATSLVPDKLGDYAITGIVTNGSNTEYHTQLYSTSALLWTHVQPINGSYTTSFPQIAMDTIAYHFYICGSYYNSTLDGILYQVDPTGVKRWTQYHNGTNSARDPFTDLVVDGLGRIFVCSPNETSTTNVYDYMIIRYSQTPVYFAPNYNMAVDTFSYDHLFYPNTLEILDTSGTFASDVLFYTKFSYPKEFIEKNKVIFGENKGDTVSRVDMYFDGANEFSEIFPAYFQDKAVLNYFLDYTGANGLTNVKGASHLICPNIYPMIDLHYSSNGNGAKYYFVVKPTGDPNNIRIRFDGGVSTATVSNNLVINSYLSSWTFKKPDVYNVSVSLPSFAITTTTVTGTGNSRWVSLGSDTYSIDPGTYDPTWPLVIEFDKGKFAAPSSTNNINWSTYWGDANQDYILDTKNDKQKNLFICGWSNSMLLPAAVNVYQAANSNTLCTDAYIAKFDSTGINLWTTFVGGSDYEDGISLDISPKDSSIYLVGDTYSNNLITKNKSGAYNDPSINNIAGPSDGFIFQLKQNGQTPLWLTYWGGNSTDTPNKCKFDKNNNFIIVGGTCSSNLSAVGSSPTYTSNYVDPNNYYDGFILKLDSATNNIKWFTYIGSSTSTSTVNTCTADMFYDLDFNLSNELVVGGYAIGDNYPTVGTGTYALAGVGCKQDGIMTRFSNSGAMLWSSYYGSDGHDVITSVKTYSNTDVYYAGFTRKAATFPTLSSSKFYHDTTKYAESVQVGGFFLNYDNSNTRIHSTLIGGNGQDYISDMEIDKRGNIYLFGKTGSTNIPAPIGGNPPNTYNTLTNAGYTYFDYLIFTLQPGLNDVLWSCLVGGNFSEGYGGDRAVNGTIDDKNRMFLTGTTASTVNFPFDNGGGGSVWFQNTRKGSQDGSITRFTLTPVNFVGISENKKIADGLFVYPNPAQNEIYIKIEKFKEKQSFKVYNNLGQIVLFGNLDSSMNHVNLSSLTTGMYILEVISKDSKASAKFIKYD